MPDNRLYPMCIHILLVILLQSVLITDYASGTKNLCSTIGCCAQTDNKCRGQEKGVFCYCDEGCLKYDDCCQDYYIICVPGVTGLYLNLNTRHGNQRDDIISNLTTYNMRLAENSVTQIYVNTNSAKKRDKIDKHDKNITVLIADCPTFPVWFDIESNVSNPLPGETIKYYCRTGYTFEDQDTEKLTQRTQTCDWDPSLKQCTVIKDAVAEAEFQAVVEAPAAVYLGTMAIIFLAVEITLLAFMDIPVYQMYIRQCCKLCRSKTCRRSPKQNKDIKCFQKNKLPVQNSIEDVGDSVPEISTLSAPSHQLCSSEKMASKGEEVTEGSNKLNVDINKRERRLTTSSVILDYDQCVSTS